MNTVRIGDICEILNGFAFKSENYVDYGIRVIRIANVQKGYIEDTTPVFYPLDAVGLDKYMLEGGDLLMSLTGNVGRVAILADELLPAALNQRVACLRMKSDKVSKDYLYHILNSDFFEQKCIQSSKGVAQKNMSTEWLKDYEIPLYSEKKQTEIISVLGRVQAVIASRKEELQRLDELIKARFVEMFDNKYPTVILGDVIKTTSGGTPSKAHPEYYNGGTIPWLSSGEVNAGVITSVKNCITEEGMRHSSAKMVPKDSVVVAMYGATAGVTGILRIDTTTNQAVCSLLPTERFIPDFLYHAVASKKEWMISQCQGGGQPNISQGIIKSMELIDAPIDDQKCFTQFVKQVDKSKSIEPCAA